MEELLRRLGVVINRAADGDGGASGAAEKAAADKAASDKAASDKAAADAAAAKAAEEAAGGEGEGDGDEEGEGDEAKPHWAERRLGEETGKRREAERRVAAAEAEVARLKAEKTTTPPKEGEKPVGKSEAEIEAEVEKKAAEKALRLTAQAEFDKMANDTADKGRAEYKDFDSVMRRFVTIGGLDTLERDKGFMSTAMATENPAKVFYELGKNLEEAERILALPLPRMAIEMDKLARTKPKKVSQAPNPPTPVGGNGEPLPEGLNDQLTSEEWHRRRDAEVAAMREHGHRRRLTG